MRIATLSVLLVFGIVSGYGAQPEEYKIRSWKLRVSLIPEKTTFMLGEPIFVSYQIHNDSNEDLSIIVSPSWSASGRDEGFKVRTVRGDGAVVSVPEEGDISVGGSRVIAPEMIPAKGDYSFTLFLPEWAEFKEPGEYAITARRAVWIGKYSDECPKLEGSDYPMCTKGNTKGKADRFEPAATAKVSVVPLDRKALGAVIAARSRTMFEAAASHAEELRKLSLSPDPLDTLTSRPNPLVWFSSGARTRGWQSPKALAVIDDDRIIEIFARALTEPGFAYIGIAISALGRFADDRALEGLKLAANSPDNNTRHLAAFALSHSPHPKALEVLIAMWDDPFDRVRAEAKSAANKPKDIPLFQAGWFAAARQPGPNDFSVLPPIEDANPAIRHNVYLRMPVAVAIKRTADTLMIQTQSFALVPPIMVGSKMVTGAWTDLFVFPKGEHRPAAAVSRRLSETGAFPDITLHTKYEGIPERDKTYVVEMDVTVFETDIPPQHLWHPETGKYRILWRGTLTGEEGKKAK